MGMLLLLRVASSCTGLSGLLSKGGESLQGCSSGLPKGWSLRRAEEMRAKTETGRWSVEATPPLHWL